MNLTSLIPAPYRWAMLILLAGAVGGFGYVKGLEHGEAKLNDYIQKRDAEVLAQVQKAAQKTTQLQADAQTMKEAKDEEIHAINDRLSDALERLRQRPNRRPNVPKAAAACSGATGADLSKPDAEFLARYDALAQRYQAQLRQCKAQYDAAVKAVNGE